MDFFVVCTDVRTGEPIYHKCRTGDAEDIRWMQASASMPLAAKIVKIGHYQLLDAVVAVEDKRFWEHNGVDFLTTTKAGISAVLQKLGFTGFYGGATPGASTITQQVVRNITNDRAVDGAAGWARKLREIWNPVLWPLTWNVRTSICLWSRCSPPGSGMWARSSTPPEAATIRWPWTCGCTFGKRLTKFLPL